MSVVPWQANQRFGQYVLVRPIAIGGMAEVWQARLDGPQGFEKKIAVKRMTASLAEQPQFVAMFLDEARLMASLTHPNICQVFELGQRDDNFYVAMEYIAGQTVHSIMRSVTRKQMKLPLELAVKIIRDAADALSYAHLKRDETGAPLNIIHRDVSPQNIMVTYEGVAKLLDFGIAKAATRTVATETGQLKGKMSYMPPEQARGEELDARVDQFALGVTLFEMVTHTRLYPAMKEMDLFREVATGVKPYPSPRERDALVPEELSSIIEKMMQRDREARYDTMAEVRDRLTQFLHGRSGSLPSNEALAVFMRFLYPPEEREKEFEGLAQAAAPAASRPSGTFTLAPATPQPAAPVAPAVEAPLPAVRPSRRGLFAALGATALLVVALAVWFASRGSEPAPKPPEPVKSVALPSPEVIDAGEAVAIAVAPLPVEPAPAEDAGVEEVSDAAPAIGTKPAKKARGKLSLQTTPWTIVYFGKKSLGETPLVEVSMPSGKHRLRLVNDEKKLSTTIEVDIKAGKTTTMRLKF